MPRNSRREQWVSFTASPKHVVDRYYAPPTVRPDRLASRQVIVSGLGQRFILSSQLNPIYEFGDFDGDGLLDLAVQIKDTGGLLYISRPDAPGGWVVWTGGTRCG